MASSNKTGTKKNLEGDKDEYVLPWLRGTTDAGSEKRHLRHQDTWKGPGTADRTSDLKKSHHILPNRSRVQDLLMKDGHTTTTDAQISSNACYPVRSKWDSNRSEKSINFRLMAELQEELDDVEKNMESMKKSTIL